MSKTLVTGGTGFIGAALVKKLVALGHDVRVFDNNFRGSMDNLESVKNDIEFIEGDIRDAQKVKTAVEGVQSVYHLAFINGTEFFYTKPDLVLEVGVKGTINVLDAIKSCHTKNLIFASSSEIYQSPPQIPTPEEVPGLVPDVKNPRYSYGGGKLIGEILTLHYLPKDSTRRIIFRPHNVYGPAMGWKHVIPELMTKIDVASEHFKKKQIEISIQGDGSETRAFCYIDDAINGIVACGEKGNDGEVYHVGTQEEVSMREMIKLLGNSIDIGIKTLPGELRPGGTLRRCPDISRLQSLGYKPAINLEEGLKRTAQWYKSRLLELEK